MQFYLQNKNEKQNVHEIEKCKLQFPVKGLRNYGKRGQLIRGGEQDKLDTVSVGSVGTAMITH